MQGQNSFRLPDGSRLVSQQGHEYQLRVDMPGDADGFFGRQCPSCCQLFRVNADDYEALPEDIRLWCVYCGHEEEHSEFITDQQVDRATRVAYDLGVQLVAQGLDDTFSRLARKSRGGGSSIRVSYRSKPFYPEPLPGIDEERLIRVRQCVSCALRYAVFGEHRYCPVCGLLSADVVAADVLQAEAARLDALAQLPVGVVATLREQGVFTRLWVDTLENLVGLVEALAGATYRAAVPNAEQNLRGKGNIFQRLDDTAALFADAGYRDLRTSVAPAVWQRLIEVWTARHLFTHNDGIVDQRYLDKNPGAPVELGQRLTITDQLCRQALCDVEVLCHAITGLTQTP
ncbi:hypothetical protein OG589_41575 [Sphaerisporangium sp. NBC_01403]|uniref:hypothetical protein n=1 Tax=Sphaerisporangium sp. NBC_01403 TaxID=2903599 RepID=UPI00324BCA5B